LQWLGGEELLQQSVDVWIPAAVGTYIAVVILTIAAAESIAWCSFSYWTLPF